MSFSYSLGANPAIDYVRLLVSDTQDTNHVFEDQEILSFHAIQAGTFQSSMLYSGGAGANLPSQPVSYLRVAALALDSIASNKARMAVSGLLDGKTQFQAAAKQLHAQADAWREVDDNSGAFCIIEQCSTEWAFKDRWFKQIQRQMAL